MTLSCSDVCEEIDRRLRALGFDYPDDPDGDHDPIFEALEQCVIRRLDDAILYAVIEDQLAIAWAEARCPDCQTIGCELDGSAHDLSGYYNMPEEQKQELRERAKKALMYSSVPEAVGDVLVAVAERT